jgi:hypothetical protein
MSLPSKNGLIYPAKYSTPTNFAEESSIAIPTHPNK